MAIEPAAVGTASGYALDSIELHYTARASLLGELSRQTYDTFYKAIREAVLNGIDAGATEVRIDLAPECGAEMVVEDDGHGMDAADLAQRFLAVGGSSKYGDSGAFGRIGIGSLALLAYADLTEILTKRAGETTRVRAILQTPSTKTDDERNDHLSSFMAGSAQVERYDGNPSDHFTRLRLLALRPEAREVIQNPSATYGLIDRLRRILPLPLKDGRVFDAMNTAYPELARVVEAHTAKWSRPILIRSRYDDWRPLTRRVFGDDLGPVEAWSGALEPIYHRLRVRGRDIFAAGFMLAQKRADARWSGITARVQNVAVAEATFFGVTNDPGFRKYITGEVFLLGDLDQDRLVNINRTSFNEECADYIALARFMGEAIDGFKKRSVARDQRAKVQVRRCIDGRRDLIATVRSVLSAVSQLQEEYGIDSLPASATPRIAGQPSCIAADLASSGVCVEREQRQDLWYRVELPEQGDAIVAYVDESLLEPFVELCGQRFRLRFANDPRPQVPRVRFNIRPRQVTINLFDCRDSGGKLSHARVSMAVALEGAFLLSEAAGSDLYEAMNEISGRI